MDLDRSEISFNSTTINQNLNEAFRLTQTIYFKEREEALTKLLLKQRRKKQDKKEDKSLSDTLPLSPIRKDKGKNILSKKQRGNLIDFVCNKPKYFNRHKNEKLFIIQQTHKNQTKLPLQFKNSTPTHHKILSLSFDPEDTFKSSSNCLSLSPRKKSAERDLMNRKINNILTACELTSMKIPSIQLNKQVDKELNIAKAFKQNLDWTTDTLQELANNEGEILSNMYLHHRSAKIEEAIDKRYVAKCFKETANDPATRLKNLSKVLKSHKNRFL